MASAQDLIGFSGIGSNPECPNPVSKSQCIVYAGNSDSLSGGNRSGLSELSSAKSYQSTIPKNSSLLTGTTLGKAADFSGLGEEEGLSILIPNTQQENPGTSQSEPTHANQDSAIGTISPGGHASPASAPPSTVSKPSFFFYPHPDLCGIIDSLIPSKVTTETAVRVHITGHVVGIPDGPVIYYQWYIHYGILYDDEWLLLFPRNPRRRYRPYPLQAYMSMSGARETEDGLGWLRELDTPGIWACIQPLAEEDMKEWRPTLRKPPAESRRPPPEIATICAFLPKEPLEYRPRKRSSYDLRSNFNNTLPANAVLPSAAPTRSRAPSHGKSPWPPKSARKSPSQPAGFGPLEEFTDAAKRNKLGRLFRRESVSVDYQLPREMSDNLLFGGKLNAIVQRDQAYFTTDSQTGNDAQVPRFVQEATKVIEQRGIEVVGIYRIPGHQAEINRARSGFNLALPDGYMQSNGTVASLLEFDVHVVSSVLKLFFRELSEPLVPYSQWDAFMAAARLDTEELRTERLRQLVVEMPPSHRFTLKHLVGHLVRVAAKSDINKMTAVNLATVFSPNILRSESPQATGIVEIGLQTHIVEQMIRLEHQIFVTTLKN